MSLPSIYLFCKSVLTHNHSIYNNYHNEIIDGIDTRDGAQLLVENNVFENTKKALFADGGYAVARGNDFGGATNTAPNGTFSTPPYSYSLTPTGSVKSTVSSGAGANLSF